MTTTTLYNLKVWLTAVVAGAAFLDFTELTEADGWAGAIFIFVIVTVAGAVLSLPSLLIQWAITEKMYYTRSITMLQIKALLSATGVVLTVLPFVVCGCMIHERWVFDKSFLEAILGYALSIVAGIWIYKLPLNNWHSINKTSNNDL